MKKLFLTSVNIDKLPEFIGKDTKGLKVAFIQTAADPYEDKWFVEADRKKLIEFGFNLIDLDLKDKNQNELQNVLDGVDIIYITGGNSFYLLDKMQQSGFDKILPDLLEQGIIYAGSSAGAVVIGSSLEPIRSLDDPSKAPNLKLYNGLGLVDFVIIPHYGKEKYKEKQDKIISEYSDKFKIQTLTDNQTILVDGDNYRLVGEGDEIKL
jgi:dipeptidase E